MTGTERKVFQKYYPPDFDPSKIPKAKGVRNRQFVQRVMAPFNMQCNTCNEYIYKGKKFNMRRETAEGETYLGMKIFRFYFKCPNCLAEITFKTDMENVDYKGEHGATRLFDAFKTYQEQERAKETEEEEEKGDAMKMLEKRTKMSKMEMEELGKLEEIQETNRRVEHVDALSYLANAEQSKQLTMAQLLKLQEEEDERTLQRLLGKNADGRIERRITDDEAPCLSSSNSRVASAPIATKTIVKTKNNDDEDVIFARPADPPPQPAPSLSLSASSSLPSSSASSSSLPAVKRPLLAPNKLEKKAPRFMTGVVIKKAKATS